MMVTKHSTFRRKEVEVMVRGDETHEEHDVRELLREDGKGTGAKYMSSFEVFMGGLLVKNGISFVYEKVSFLLGWKTQDSHKREPKYTPDFVTDLTVGGKTVLVETHGKAYFDDFNLRKFSKFMKMYGSRYHLIIVSDITPWELAAKMKKYGIATPIASEIWHTGDYYGKYAMVGRTRVDLEEVYLDQKLGELKARDRAAGDGGGAHQASGQAVASVVKKLLPPTQLRRPVLHW